MEMKQLFPDADVFNFYMDIRMFGPGYEEMYREAQQKYNIHFIRGRISEASPTIDGRVQIKAEDTLTGRPLPMTTTPCWPKARACTVRRAVSWRRATCSWAT